MDDKQKIVNKLLGKTLKISRKRFVEWMYNDKDSMNDLANDIMDSLIADGKCEKDINDIWKGCGYISKDMVENPEVAEWDENEEIEMPSESYEVEWVD